MHLADNRDELQADMSMQSKSPNFIDLIVVNVLKQENSLSCLKHHKEIPMLDRRRHLSLLTCLGCFDESYYSRRRFQNR